MDAIILAGALNSGSLRGVSPAQYEAEIEIAGRTMLDYVISAVRRVNSIDRIMVVGSAKMLTESVKKEIFGSVTPGLSLMDSLMNGLNALEIKEPVLIITADIPMITQEALEDFLQRCRNRAGDVFYSVVPKEANEAKYPGVQRTYVKFSEGTFTGGNIVLIAPQVIRENMNMLSKAIAMRKKPLQLCSMLGWHYLIKLLLGKLTIGEIEERVTKMFHFKAVGIISPYPEVGIDVDKPSDLKLAQEVLSK